MPVDAVNNMRMIVSSILRVSVFPLELSQACTVRWNLIDKMDLSNYGTMLHVVYLTYHLLTLEHPGISSVTSEYSTPDAAGGLDYDVGRSLLLSRPTIPDIKYRRRPP